MFKKSIIAGVIMAGVLASSQAMASPHSYGAYRINQMQAEQARMIERGVRSGALTRYEESVLRAEQRRIRSTEYRYKRNGLSRWEVKDLISRLESAERHIKHQLYDNDRERRYRDRDDRRHDRRSDNRHGDWSSMRLIN